MNYCTKCGKKLNENELICSKCGNTIYNTIEDYHQNLENSEKEHNKLTNNQNSHERIPENKSTRDKYIPFILTLVAILAIPISRLFIDGPEDILWLMIGITISATILIYLAIKYVKNQLLSFVIIILVIILAIIFVQAAFVATACASGIECL